MAGVDSWVHGSPSGKSRLIHAVSVILFLALTGSSCLAQLSPENRISVSGWATKEERKVDPASLFQYGIEALSASLKEGVADSVRDALLDEAKQAFHAVLVIYPYLVRPRLELARVLFLQGEDRLAKKHFKRALAADPPAPVVINIKRYLHEIRARRHWNAYFGVALAPDSNIGGHSNERIINFEVAPGLFFPFELDEQRESGTGVLLQIGGEYRHPLDEVRRIRIGGSVSRREYKEKRFDGMTASLHAGPHWLASKRSEISLLTIGRQHWKADKPEYRDIGLLLEVGRRLNRRTILKLTVNRLQRHHDTDAALEGPILDISLRLDHVLMPTLRIHSAIGWSREKPGQTNRRNKSWWLDGKLTALWPRGITAGVHAGLRWTDFESGSYLTGGQIQKDEIRRFGLSVHRRNFTIAGFSPELAVTWTERKSNNRLSAYDRVFGELRLTRPF